MESPEHCSILLDDYTALEPSGYHETANIGGVIVNPTREHFLRMRPSPWFGGNFSLGTESGGEPVRLAAGIIKHAGETKSLEPRRGPGAEVSLVIPAIDDDRMVGHQTRDDFTRQHLQRYVNGAGDVLFGVLLLGQDFHECCACLNQSLQVISFNGRDHVS